MKNEFAWIHGFDRIAAAITKQLLHDLNLKKQETTQVKREVSCIVMLVKLMYLRTRIYYDVRGSYPSIIN
jgi:hypothetical protein